MRRALAALALVTAMAACTRVLDLGEEGGACGEGSCKPGVMCTTTCASCFCNASADWYCSTTCAEDAGTECPASLPGEGTTCTNNGARCTYQSRCDRELDTALCVAGVWQTYPGRCPPPEGCPKDPPPLASPCSLSVRCPYQNKCGVVFEAVCDGTGWFVERPPPCPTDGCPASAPAARTSCSGDAKCAWPNACGTLDFGTCTGGYWTVNPTCTPAGCPSFAPPSGAPCGSEGVSCTWSNGCDGGTRDGSCQSGKWTVGACR